MDETKMGKVAALLIAAIVIGLVGLSGQVWPAIGIYSGGGWVGHLLYHFFHANLLHAGLNVWCLLAVVFVYKVSFARLLLAYIIASVFPVDTLAMLVDGLDTPTVGLSGMVFVLFGSISFEVGRKGYYQAWMLCYLVMGFLFSGTNAWLHLYCYMAGFMVALLNKPITVSRNGG